MNADAVVELQSRDLVGHSFDFAESNHAKSRVPEVLLSLTILTLFASAVPAGALTLEEAFDQAGLATNPHTKHQAPTLDPVAQPIDVALAELADVLSGPDTELALVGADGETYIWRDAALGSIEPTQERTAVISTAGPGELAFALEPETDLEPIRIKYCSYYAAGARFSGAFAEARATAKETVAFAVGGSAGMTFGAGGAVASAWGTAEAYGGSGETNQDGGGAGASSYDGHATARGGFSGTDQGGGGNAVATSTKGNATAFGGQSRNKPLPTIFGGNGGTAVAFGKKTARAQGGDGGDANLAFGFGGRGGDATACARFPASLEAVAGEGGAGGVPGPDGTATECP